MMTRHTSYPPRCVVHIALLAIIVACSLLDTAFAASFQSLNFQVEPKSEDCLYEDIAVNAKVNTNVLVTRGGKLDIKYRVSGPDGIAIHEKMVFSNVNDDTGQVMGHIVKKSFDFVAHQAGFYSFCFNNQMSRWTAKVVDLEINVEEEKEGIIEPLAEDLPGKPSPVGGMEKRTVFLDRMFDKVIKEQLYHRRREEANRNTADSSNSRVMWFTLLETAVLLGASALQLYVVRTWFPAKQLGRSGV